LKYNQEKIDDLVLALMYLGLHDENRVWKTLDWGSCNRLFEKGLISNPVSKSKSVILTAEGKKKSEQLFKKYFVIDSTYSK